MSTYAQNADVEAYIEGWVTDDPAALTRVIERAEQDLDTLLFGAVSWPDPPLVTNRKLDPASLSTQEVRTLNRATCAQTEYRITMGEDFFRRAQFQSTSGPGGFSSQGKLPALGPKVQRELLGTTLLARTQLRGARAVPGDTTRVSSWPGTPPSWPGTSGLLP
jgi:hypothetical protein